MQRFQGLHVVSKDRTPERPSTGLEPYLALDRPRKCKPNAKDYWLTAWAIGIGSGTTLFLVLYGIAHKMGAL